MNMSAHAGQHSVPGHPGLTAYLPVPLLFLAIIAVWAADWRTAHESTVLLTGLSLIFPVLGSLCIAALVARSFLANPSPGLLLLSCGALLWGASGLAVVVAILFKPADVGFFPNTVVTIHNTCTWGAALCHLAGAALSLRWSAYTLRTPRIWLAASWIAVLCAVAGTVVATWHGWLATFFTAESGATFVRQWVLGCAIGMLLLTSVLLRERRQTRLSAFVAWYVLALLLQALGLFGVMIEPTVGSIGGWLGRGTQYLGSCYLFVAALAAARGQDKAEISLGEASHRFFYTYGMAVAIVLCAVIARLVFMQSLGERFAFLTFYPAVMVAALYGGLRAGMLATLLAALLAYYFWIEPAGAFAIEHPGDVLGIVVFVISALAVSWIAEIMHRALQQRREAEEEQRRLNRALRLLSDCNQTLVRARSEGELLSDLCQLVVDSGGYRMAWVGLAEQDGAKGIKLAAQTDCSEAFLAEIDFSWDKTDQADQGPAGAAIRSRIPQLRSKDTAQGTDSCDCNHAPGVSACLALPLVSDGQILGALSIYAAEADAFAASELALLEKLAGNVGFGLQALRGRRELESNRRELEERVTLRTAELEAANLQSRLLNLELEQRVEARTRDLAESRLRFQALFDFAPVACVVWEPGFRVMEWNRMAETTFGWSRAEVLGRNFFEFAVPKEAAPHVRAVTGEALEHPLTTHSVNRNLTRSGRQISCEWYNAGVADAAGQPTCVISMGRDISGRESAAAEQRRLHRALRLLSTCNQTVVRATDEQALLDHVCQLLVEAGDYPTAWVSMAGQDAAKSARPVASFGDDGDQLSNIRLSWDEDLDIGRGPTGSAIRTGRTQISLACQSNPLLEPWRELVQALGVESALALPLTLDDKVVGALTIGARDLEAFGEAEVELLEELASNLSFGLQALNARKTLEGHRQDLENRVQERTEALIEARQRLSSFATEQQRVLEQERQRISREVHDQIGQIFTSIKLITGALAPDSLPPELARGLAQALEMGIATTRRITAELRPPMLDDMGLAAALEHFGREVSARANLACDVQVIDDQKLSEDQSLGLFRIVQEAITNILRHADADHIHISGHENPLSEYVFTIIDNGSGFDPGKVSAGAFGLAGMRERASLLGGACRVKSTPDRGTLIQIRFPLPKNP